MKIFDKLFGITGRVALVTGGSSGIGRAIAFCLAEAGAAVIHVARKEEELQDAVKDVENINGKAAYLTCDLSDMDALAETAENSGITCNAIGPGFFKTGLTSDLYNQEQVVDALARQTIIGRNGDLDDLKGIALFLASPASDYITGQTIYLDGGWTAK